MNIFQKGDLVRSGQRVATLVSDSANRFRQWKVRLSDGSETWWLESEFKHEEESCPR